MEKIRYGIVGVGNQGSYYSTMIFDGGLAKDAVLTAICDNNPAKIERIKSKLQNTEPAYFDNFIDMLDSGLCDAVLIETPHYDHPEMVKECLKRDIHVVCEKPAGVYAAQVKDMNRAADNAKAKFGMMFNQRTNPIYQKMREIIMSGELGQLQRVTWIITNWFRTQYYYDSGSWRATWNGEGGGVLINQCPHQLDLISWIIGEQPEYVTGHCEYGKWHDIEVEDEVTAFLEYKNGATGVFITTTGEAPGTNRLEISGTRGKLVCDEKHLTYHKNSACTQEWLYNDANGYQPPLCEVVNFDFKTDNLQHADIINNFTAALLGKEELFVDGREGINGVELMNAIEMSGWKGGVRVKLPVDEAEYLSILEEKRKTSRFKPEGNDKVSDTAAAYH